MDAASLVATYGYPAIVLGAVLEGESIVIAAGYLAHRQHLPLAGVIACAAIGATLGDQGYFLLGRRNGDRAVARLPARLGRRIDRARALIAAHPLRAVVSMRFLYGMRVALPILCGASGMSLSFFARYNVATAVVWAALFSGLGYLFGAAATALIGKIARYEWWVLLGLVATLLAVKAVLLLRNREARRS